MLDISRTVIPNAEVTIANQATGAARTTRSGDSGRFVAPGLLPGRYRVTVVRSGFKSAIIRDIDLQIGQAVELEVILELGSMLETLSVQAGSSVLQTETAALGQVIADRTIVDLPLNGRNFLQLAALTAGVVPATATTSDANRIGRAETTIHVTGARSGFTSYLIDGQESRGSRFGEATLLPQPEAIMEFKVQRNFSSAEFGGSPGILSIYTKSGANQFHGSAYEFLRNSALDSAGYFDGGAPPPFRLNQFGGTIGGPVSPDRTFFFVGYEGRRQRLATARFARVPGPELLGGNFSPGTPITDPWNNNAPFPGFVIPANRADLTALNFKQYIPAPNTARSQGNYSGAKLYQ